ncbi:uncharacterized protein F4807DRAFT_469518 [Annulohypoxylon truncatum]|uniref:uncharacterized protein n=1 Tax=Annulohypoxylon truncatum TaxID=327061 RepID=UPI002008A4EF|nr:uncharacterized protein F4807DRAFT_469518 [Annulohypoxylon truncatum]KAI1213639.1 hypothetical protein F4807DRAFT_469518 [Annulohypoxylon truncatum]
MAPTEQNQNGGKDLYSFLNRYHQYEEDKERTHTLIKDLLVYAERTETRLLNENSNIRKQLADTRLDLEGVTKAHKETQRRLADMEVRLGYVPDRNPYIMVLIDGDGLLFKDQLVRQGLEGGRKAARDLNTAIIQKFNYTGDTPVTVVAKVVANVPGLARAMKRNNCIPNEATLYEFIAGFSQIKPDFEFADVGYGKERADAKIIDSARFHLRNYNCKQIVMGISHNAGYGPFLDGLINNDNTKQRITILEGTPTVQAILNIGVSVMNFHTIFRTEKLDPKSPAPRPILPTSNGASYAAVAQTKGAAPPPQITLPMHSRRNSTIPAKSPPPEWNPGPRGIDPPIVVSAAVLERLKKRKGEEKLCNNHFLRGPCTKGDECVFEHDYKPTKEEKKVIALFARLNPCTSGQDCEVDNCIYGHHCPSIVNGVCTHPRCKFAIEDHPPGTKFKYPRDSE